MVGLRVVTLQPEQKLLTSNQRFRIAGGGGDMATVKDRAEKSTTLIANTAEMASMRIMCGAVIKDFDTNGQCSVALIEILQIQQS